MNSSKRIVNYFKKHWITIWIVVAALALCGVVAYAKFSDNQNTAKRVIAADTGVKTYFTSNYLTGYSYKNYKTVTLDSANVEPFEVSIYNYDKNNPTSFYPSPITFKFTAKLFKNNGATEYNATNDAAVLNTILGNDEIEIYKVDLNGDPVSGSSIILNKTTVSGYITETLTPAQGEKSAKNTYKVVLPLSVTDKDIYVKLEADPTEQHPDLSMIDAFFYAKSNNIDLSSGWSGDFNDSTANPPSSYDAFNYTLTGSGTMDKILSWDNNLLEPNRMQINDIFGIDLTDSNILNDTSIYNYDSTTGIASLKISLSSASSGGRYDIQFYVVDENARKEIDGYTGHQPMTWPTLKTKITLTDPS
ncbi:hypothetical protein [Ruminococcus sp.]|uniref:hypothetical protein n=1 Tax=Ruminococcus sp. TaxID=41978 RepID=UPI00258C705A|nr:hypothetical protein [Ruminococcus sp.]MCR5019830.1 hypothetical protein [Ruminococcus sp.]